MVIFNVFLRFNDKADQHISNSHKPRIINKIPFISSMLTIVMMPGCLPQLRALCSCCFSECLVAIATSCSGKRSGYYRNLGSLRAGTRHHGEFSVMGNSFPPTFPEDLLAHASQWLANCREAYKYDELERQYKCSAHDNYVRIWYWTPLGWTSSDHGDHRDVSFPLSGYNSNRSVPFRASTDITENSPLWERYSIPPWERLRSACTSYTAR